MSHIILFDIDGTLVLTGGAGGRAMRRAFHDVFGIDDAFAEIPMHGRTDLSLLGEALARAGLPRDDAGLAQFCERYYQHLADALQEPHARKLIMPGVPQLLDALQQRDDVFLALLTGNFMTSARLKLEYFDLWRYFPCGAFGDDAEERHRLVEVALRRAAAHGAPPAGSAHVMVVGDTPLDVACAKATGALAVAVATGPADQAALRACGADVVFEDLSETGAFLELLS